MMKRAIILSLCASRRALLDFRVIADTADRPGHSAIAVRRGEEGEWGRRDLKKVEERKDRTG